MVPLWLQQETAMSATITLKNIPDTIYDSLKQAADAHHRSINSEAISCLERVLLPSRTGQEERMARARQIRTSLNPKQFKAADIAKAIEQGRP
jgi:plasmid stability protein